MNENYHNKPLDVWGLLFEHFVYISDSFFSSSSLHQSVVFAFVISLRPNRSEFLFRDCLIDYSLSLFPFVKQVHFANSEALISDSFSRNYFEQGKWNVKATLL